MLFLVLVILLCLQVVETSSKLSLTIEDVQIKAEPSHKAHSGDNITVSCTVKVSKSGNVPVTYEYSLFKDFELLHYVNSSLETMHYRLAPARAPHSGTYYCQVKGQDKHKDSPELQITITGVSKPVLHVNRTEIIEGEPMDLYCEVPEEYQSFKFTFQITSQSHKPKEKKIKSTKNVAKLTFKDLEKGAIIFVQCKVELLGLESGTSPLSERVIIAVKDIFSTPKMYVAPSNNVTEGDILNMTCTAATDYSFTGSFEVIIKKGSQILAAEQLQKSVKYLIAQARLHDAGEYSCIAESSGVSKKISTVITVSELFSKPLLTSDQPAAYINRNTTIKCSVVFPSKIHMPEVKFIIYKDGKPKSCTKLINNTSCYFIRGAQELDGGTYICSVTIRRITKQSNSVILHVPVSVPQLSRAAMSADVVLGHTVRLFCYSKQGTLPIKYTFYRGNKVLGDVFSTKAQAEKLDVAFETLEHAGEYKCTAENQVANATQVSKSLNFTVIAPTIAAELSVIPQDGEVEDGKDLTFRCSVYNGSLPITFKLYRLGEEKHVTKLKYTLFESFHYSTVSIKEQGTYFCNASNNANSTVRSNSVTVTVTWAVWKKIVSASSVTVLLLVLGIFLVRCYFYRNKKADLKSLEMSGKTSSTQPNHQKSTSGQVNEQGASHTDEENNVDTKKEISTDGPQEPQPQVDG